MTFRAVLSRRGVSLLEVVLAIMIFMMVLIISLGFWTTCARYIGKSRARLMGTYVAERVIESAVKAGYDEVDTMAGTGAYAMDVTLRGKPIHYNIGYEVTVVDVDPTLKSVQVKVTWSQSEGIVLETFVSSEL